MSLPILHSAAGFASAKIQTGRKTRPDYLLLFTCIFAANAPDLDFIPGILMGEAAHFHRGPSHSIAAAFLFALAAGFILSRFFSRDFKQTFASIGLAYLSHLVLDFYGGGSVGLALLYPFTSMEFFGPNMVHGAPPCALETAGGLMSFISALRHSAAGAVKELLLVAACVVAYRLFEMSERFMSFALKRLRAVRVVTVILLFLAAYSAHF